MDSPALHDGVAFDVDAAVAEVAQRLAPDLERMLVLGYGSYFRGEAGPRSDVDLIWLTRSAHYEKHQFPIAGRVVEVTHMGLKRFVSAIEDGHAVYVPAGAQGRVLAAAPGIADFVRQKAQARLDAGPPAADTLDAWGRRIGTLWVDVLDAAGDDALFAMLQTELLNALYEYACAQQRIWKRGTKHMFRDLELCRPGLAAEFRATLSRTSTADRLEATRRLVRTLVPQVDA